MKRYQSVDAYIEGAEQWQEELRLLRKIVSSTVLEETVKWGAPCYVLDGKHVVGLGAFKSYVGLWFFQGALLADPERVLMNAQEGKTKALRQWRFHSKKEIKSRLVKAYVNEAITLQKQGHQIKPDRGKAITIPAELKSALARNKRAHSRFAELTRGKQRGYADYIADAKRQDTKQKRLKKILPMILAGEGLRDKYRR